MIKVFVIDDGSLLAEWLFEDLSNQEYHISGTANVDDISKAIRTSAPDIILLDIHLNGFERWIYCAKPSWNLLIFPSLSSAHMTASFTTRVYPKRMDISLRTFTRKTSKIK